MNFAEDIAWILIVCAITYPLYALFFVLAHFYKKKTQRGSGCTVFLKATVIEPLRIRIKHSYHYFMIYQYEYMGCVYQKNTGIDLAYHQAQKKIGTEVEIYIDPSDPEKYFCPADVIRVIDCDDPRRWGRILFGLSGGKGETALD